MEKRKSDYFWETVADVSELAGALARDAVVAGKKLIHYVNDLTTTDTTLEPPAESSKSDSETNAKTD